MKCVTPKSFYVLVFVSRGVVLLIDSLNFPDEAHDIAELLYDLLSDPTYHRTKAPFLVACNKQDMALATPKDKIMTTLEKEMFVKEISHSFIQFFFL